MDVDKNTARIAGLLYLIIIVGSIVGGVFSEMYMQSHLMAAGDASVIANDLMVPEGLYRIGFAVYLVVYLSDFMAALVFYVLLKPVNNSLALLAAFFRLAEAVILTINLQNHFAAFRILNGVETLAVFQPDQLQALAQQFLDVHRSGYLIGQVFFGFHCFFLGILIYKSGYFPKILGILLAAAALGYLTQSFAFFLFPNYGAMEAILSWVVAVPAFLAELALTFWLLFKSTNIRPQNFHAPASA